MADHIAIKRLTASDCTLFDAVFRTIGAGNQKSINLNADVLIDRLFPSLSSPGTTTEIEIALPMVVYGPAGNGAHTVTRKIIKNPTYKNWRLNGETIPGPAGDASRYDNVKPGDLAVMVFKGEASPIGMDLILISQVEPADTMLHGALSSLFGNKSMIAVTPTQIAAAASAAAVQETHPILIAAADPEMEAALEDAAQGGVEGTGKLLKNKGSRKISKADLTKAKVKAELIGQDGEGLLNGYLAALRASGQLANYKWTAMENAIAPFDFEITEIGGQRTLIDAKATNGPFENAIHLSLAEVIEAAGAIPYRIYRLFELDEDGSKLRKSDDIGPLAQKLKLIHETHMPAGIRVDGFSVNTSALIWSATETIVRQEDGDGV
jgi:hypothetical protein